MPPAAHSGQLDITLPSGKTKSVPWLVDDPAAPSQAGLAVCLLHGASGDAASGHLPALAAACAEAGLPCLRITCKGGQLEHRAAVTKAVLAQAASLPGLAAVRSFVLAGHSMGARVACTIANEQQQAQQGHGQESAETSQQVPAQGQPAAAAADHVPPVTACMLFSYPLHPPGKPEQLREALLADLVLPTLLVRGTKDPFSRQDLWEAALEKLGSRRWEQHSVEGGDHSLKVAGGKAGGNEAAMAGVCRAVQRFLGSVMGEQRQQQEEGRGAAGQRGGAGKKKRKSAAAGEEKGGSKGRKKASKG